VKEDEIAKAVVNTALGLYEELGPGLYESVDEGLLADALRELGFDVERPRIRVLKPWRAFRPWREIFWMR
jgi:hypothetical protein